MDKQLFSKTTSSLAEAILIHPNSRCIHTVPRGYRDPSIRQQNAFKFTCVNNDKVSQKKKMLPSELKFANDLIYFHFNLAKSNLKCLWTIKMEPSIFSKCWNIITPLEMCWDSDPWELFFLCVPNKHSGVAKESLGGQEEGEKVETKSISGTFRHATFSSPPCLTTVYSAGTGPSLFLWIS